MSRIVVITASFVPLFDAIQLHMSSVLAVNAPGRCKQCCPISTGTTEKIVPNRGGWGFNLRGGGVDRAPQSPSARTPPPKTEAQPTGPQNQPGNFCGLNEKGEGLGEGAEGLFQGGKGGAGRRTTTSKGACRVCMAYTLQEMVGSI